MSAELTGGGAITLAWPAIPGYSLYRATNLNWPVNWSPVNSPIFSSNGTNSVSLVPGRISVSCRVV